MSSSTSDPDQVDEDFLIMRHHLSRHPDIHPSFRGSRFVNTELSREMFRNHVLCLPQEDVLDVITIIQAVSSTVLFAGHDRHGP